MERGKSRLGFTWLVMLLPREHSPAITTPNNPPPTKKRKHNPPSHNSAAESPAPSDPSSLSNNPTTTENVVLPAYLYDLSTRPRLTISRAPAFVPITDDSPYHHTDQLAHNRLGFRYMPAGLASEGSTTPFRTIESAPQSIRQSHPGWSWPSGREGFPQRALQCSCSSRTVVHGGGDRPRRRRVRV